MPANQSVGAAQGALGQEAPDGLSSAQHAARSAQNAGDEGTLEDGVVGVELEEVRDVPGAGAAIPLGEDEPSILVSGHRVARRVKVAHAEHRRRQLLRPGPKHHHTGSGRPSLPLIFVPILARPRYG